METPAEYKTLHETVWRALRVTPDGYVYSHEVHCHGRGVAVLGFSYAISPMGPKFVGRFEPTPPHGPSIQMCSLTGGIEDGELPVDGALRELYEESGIQLSNSKLIELGQVRPSKGDDTIQYLFGADVTGHKLGTAPGDGTEHEANSFCRWVSQTELTNCKDPLVHTMLLRLMVAGAIYQIL